MVRCFCVCHSARLTKDSASARRPRSCLHPHTLFLKTDFIEHRATILLYLKAYIIFLAEVNVLHYNTVFYFSVLHTINFTVKKLNF